RFNEVDERFSSIDERLNAMDERFDRLETSVKEVKKGQEQLQQNIIDNMGKFTDHLTEYVEDKTAALNQRVYKIETDLQRLYRQSS
ncbi:hypothetical protein P9126_00625, partial [Bacillus glycinifermentans]|nr:hypothetical protein [Bacillus glycinifermentans]